MAWLPERDVGVILYGDKNKNMLNRNQTPEIKHLVKRVIQSEYRIHELELEVAKLNIQLAKYENIKPHDFYKNH